MMGTAGLIRLFVFLAYLQMIYFLENAVPAFWAYIWVPLFLHLFVFFIEMIVSLSSNPMANSMKRGFMYLQGIVTIITSITFVLSLHTWYLEMSLKYYVLLCIVGQFILLACSLVSIYNIHGNKQWKFGTGSELIIWDVINLLLVIEHIYILRHVNKPMSLHMLVFLPFLATFLTYTMSNSDIIIVLLVIGYSAAGTIQILVVKDTVFIIAWRFIFFILGLFAVGVKWYNHSSKLAQDNTPSYLKKNDDAPNSALSKIVLPVTMSPIVSTPPLKEHMISIPASITNPTSGVQKRY